MNHNNNNIIQSEALPDDLLPPADEAYLDDDVCEAPPAGGEEVDELVGGPSFFEEHDACLDLLGRLGEALPPPPTAAVTTTTSSSSSSDAAAGFLPTASEDPNGAAAVVDALAKILTRYQESPHLLHPYLERLVQPLVALLLRYLPPSADSHAQLEGAAQNYSSSCNASPSGLGQNFDLYDADAPKTALHHVCRALYIVVKTAGEKCSTSHFPNDVHYYEDVFYALRRWQADSAKVREWEVRYCLLLWLSNLVLVPFALSIIDSNASSSPSATNAALTLSDAVLQTAVGFLSDTSKCREGAALLVARLLTRPDSRRHREVFFAYAQEVLSQVPPEERQPTFLTESLVKGQSEDETVKPFLFPGVLLAMAKALKLGQREELLHYAPGLIPCVGDLYNRRGGDCVLCKTAVKVNQRLVLSMLRKQRATWKYKRHVAALDTNLGGDNKNTAASAAAPDGSPRAENAAVDEADFLDGDFDAVEEGVGLLIEALGHRDTVVRWSAAKGVGRVCERLPADMAKDVLDAVCELFNNEYNDSQWHGGLLALAELCRRGIIDASMLEEVVSRIAKGLAFDLSKGTYSVGAHVRDAACYTCWSIARAYDASDLEPYVHQLSAGLVVTALFDREVNVRRAAAAAFQECVGRLGNFPNGIALVTTMDFFSLSSLKNAYTNVAPIVAQHEAHRPAILDELVGTKLLHWDRVVRQNAAAALGRIAPLEALDVIQEITEELLRRVVDPTVATRHGAILGLAQLVRHLPLESWTTSQINDLTEVIVRLDAARLFRSRGGEHIRQACCELLSSCALRQLPLPEFVAITKISGEKGRARTLGKVQEFLEDTWKNILEWLQRSATDTFALVAAAYYTTYAAGFHGKVIAKMLECCGAESGASKSPLERRGFLAAMGGLPTQLLIASPASPAPTAGESEQQQQQPPYFITIIDTLRTAAIMQPGEDPDLADAETRRNAVQALGRVVCSIPHGHAAMTPELYADCVGTLLAAMKDYAVDKRGDVGSFARLAALQALPNVVRHGTANGCAWCTPQLALAVMQVIVKAAMEKLDKVRAAAGAALVKILTPSDADDIVAHLFVGGSTTAEVQLLQRLVRANTDVDWSSPGQVIDALAVPLLCECPTAFAKSAMEGLVLSAGDLTAHVQRPSMAALLASLGSTRGSTEATAAVVVTDAHRARLSQLLGDVATTYEHEERVLVPLCRCLDTLLNESVLAVEGHAALVMVLRAELKHFATNIVVLLPFVSLLANLCRSPAVGARHDAWSLALTMVASRYPKVRSKMATDLYTALLVLTAAFAPDGSPSIDTELEGCRKAMDHLLAVQWDGTDATKIRSARNKLYPMLGIQPPQKQTDDSGDMRGVKRTAANTKVASSYMHLVQEAGY